MRTALLAALLGTTAFAFGAQAQTPAPAAVPECDRLLAFLDESRPVAGVTVQQARRWKQESRADECRRALDRVTQASNAPVALPPRRRALRLRLSPPRKALPPPRTQTPGRTDRRPGWWCSRRNRA